MKEFEQKEEILKNSVGSLSGTSDLEKYGKDSEIAFNADGTVSDIEVVVTPEASEEDLERRSDYEAQVVQETKKKERQTKRSGRTERRLAEYQQIANQIAEENSILRDQLAQQTNYSHIQREQQLKERVIAVNEVLKKAKEEGDIDQEVAATNLLTKYNAEMVAAKNSPRVQAQPSYNQAYSEPQIQHNPVLDEIYAENDWLIEGTDNYDPGLVSEATQAEVALARQWRLAGYGDQVGSYEFYQNVVNMVKDRHGLPTQTEIASSASQSRQAFNNGRNMNQARHQYVSPVDRHIDTGNIRQVGSRVNVTLTPEQREIARKLPLYDNNKQPLSDAQKEIAYAKQLVKGQR